MILRNGFLRCLSIAAAVAILASYSAPAQQPSTVQPKQGTLLFTVSGKDLRYVKQLQAENVRLMVNDSSREILSLESLAEQPLSLAILIDTSISQERSFKDQKLAADLFLQVMMRPGKDQGALVSFSNDATIEQALTNDIAQLRQALAKVKTAGPAGYFPGGVLVTDPSVLGLPKNTKSIPGSTAIWDAVWATCEDLFGALPQSRKAIILLTDGYDTSSRTKMREAAERAVKIGVAVYAIGIGNPEFGVAKDDLKKLAAQTGGYAFFPKKNNELEITFAEIAQHLRSQYKLTYELTSEKPGAPEKIRIELIDPDLRKNLRVSYQQTN